MMVKKRENFMDIIYGILYIIVEQYIKVNFVSGALYYERDLIFIRNFIYNTGALYGNKNDNIYIFMEHYICLLNSLNYIDYGQSNIIKFLDL